jgi:hypothetical protein
VTSNRERGPVRVRVEVRGLPRMLVMAYWQKGVVLKEWRQHC